MKLIASAVIALSSIAPIGVAFADADDIKWVAQCMMDNKSEGKAETVVRIYCECMNNKMSDSETQSITQWEKSHPKEQAECDAKAGWK